MTVAKLTTESLSVMITEESGHQMSDSSLVALQEVIAARDYVKGLWIGETIHQGL